MNTMTFKLHAPDGKLLWKVKVTADRVKISDNEENKDPYELRTKDDGARVERNGVELAEVKFYRDRQKTKVKVQEMEKFDIHGNRYSSAYGVLAIGAIPEQERAILIAELLPRGT